MSLETTFWISANPALYGDDVDDDMAGDYAARLAVAVADEFPHLDVRVGEGSNVLSDHDGEVQEWINNHWLAVA